jgi:hypothetical protein
MFQDGFYCAYMRQFLGLLHLLKSQLSLFLPLDIWNYGVYLKDTVL